MYDQSYADTMTNSFCAATNIMQDKVSVYTQGRLWRRNFCDRAKLCRVDIETGESNVGWVLRRTTKSNPA